jgi:hypothetical protein
MDCLSCDNCKVNQPTYYCLAKDEVVINENYIPEEKSRTGWKKGSTDYEKHRRSLKKEIEV